MTGTTEYSVPSSSENTRTSSINAPVPLSVLWINTFWPSVCGGFGNDDDAALAVADPAEVYGQYIEMGATMIQTDRPELLINYLRSIGRHD